MDLTRRYISNKNIIRRDEEDGAFLFDPDTGNLKYMNHSAREIFLMLNGKTSVNHLVENLQKLYNDVAAEHLQDDVYEFLKQLESGGFISLPDSH